MCLWTVSKYFCSLGSCRFLGAGGGICVWADTAAPLPCSEEATTSGARDATEMLNVLHVEVLRKWRVMGIFSKNYLPSFVQF